MYVYVYLESYLGHSTETVNSSPNPSTFKCDYNMQNGFDNEYAMMMGRPMLRYKYTQETFSGVCHT